jgi:hypothetical protein
MFTSCRLKDGASKLCVKRAGKDSFYDITRAIVPKFYPKRQMLCLAG